MNGKGNKECEGTIPPQILTFIPHQIEGNEEN